jgi:hypothetical protein
VNDTLEGHRSGWFKAFRDKAKLQACEKKLKRVNDELNDAMGTHHLRITKDVLVSAPGRLQERHLFGLSAGNTWPPGLAYGARQAVAVTPTVGAAMQLHAIEGPLGPRKKCVSSTNLPQRTLETVPAQHASTQSTTPSRQLCPRAQDLMGLSLNGVNQPCLAGSVLCGPTPAPTDVAQQEAV